MMGFSYLLFLSCILVAFSSSTVHAECPPGGCGPFGNCIIATRGCDGEDCREFCNCDPGYAGAACSFVVTTCPGEVNDLGSRTCYNGGKCVEKTSFNGVSETSQWSCDCRDATGEAGRFAGDQCEFPGASFCLKNNKHSDYAFCTNGGKCRGYVNDGELHPGCRCPGGFVGRHCQYTPQNAPVEELAFGQEEEGMGGAGIFFVVVLAFGFVGGVAFFVMKDWSGKESDTADARSGPVDHDLHLDESPESNIEEAEVI